MPALYVVDVFFKGSVGGMTGNQESRIKAVLGTLYPPDFDFQFKGHYAGGGFRLYPYSTVFIRRDCRVGFAFHAEPALVDISQDRFALKAVDTDPGYAPVTGKPGHFPG
jgi:hypothetical protein